MGFCVFFYFFILMWQIGKKFKNLRRVNVASSTVFWTLVRTDLKLSPLNFETCPFVVWLGEPPGNFRIDNTYASAYAGFPYRLISHPEVDYQRGGIARLLFLVRLRGRRLPHGQVADCRSGLECVPIFWRDR